MRPFAVGTEHNFEKEIGYIVIDNAIGSRKMAICKFVCKDPVPWY